MSTARHRAKHRRPKAAKPWTIVAAFALILGWLVVVDAHITTAQATVTATKVCGTDLVAGPSGPPSGAVTIPAGDDSSWFDHSLPANTSYYFAAGTHTIGTGAYSQIAPGDGDSFVGAPGAILSGQWDNKYAFADTGTGVTVAYLTVEDFTPSEGEGAVNQGAGTNWTVEHDTIEHNAPGAGVMVGTNNVLKYDCLTENGEYGFDAYVDPSDPSASSLTGGPSDVTVSNDEISYNDTCNWEDVSPDPVPAADVPGPCKAGVVHEQGCGCSGGGKFWRTDGAVISDNYVHDNYNVGIWADTDNTGFGVSGNTFADNWSVGYQEEISYNFSITGNTFTDNAWGSGPATRGFPSPAVYVSESGGDDRVPGAYSGTALVSDNTFDDNWSGIVLWQSSDRFCSDGSDGPCTLIDPSVFTVSWCAANLSSAAPGKTTGTPPADYWDGCLWKTQDVRVTDNTFDLTQADIPNCELSADSCGENAVFSQYGTTAPYDHPSPYTIADDIANKQANHFADNTYAGPWSFVALTQGKVVTAAQWTGGFTDSAAAGDSFGAQDAGSTFDGADTTATPPPVSSTTIAVTTTSPTDTTTTLSPEPSVGASFQFRVTEGGTTFSCSSQDYGSATAPFTALCAPYDTSKSGLSQPFHVTYESGTHTWDCVTSASASRPGWWEASCKVA